MTAEYISREPHMCAVYLLSNPSRSIYVGATVDLERRVFQHKTHAFESSHTAKYGIDRLVWYELQEDWDHAHARELELKGWRRSRKIELVQVENPRWLDLSYGLFHWSSSRFKS